MRLVRTLVPEDGLAAVESVLDGYDIDYVVVNEAGDTDAEGLLVEFPVPTQAVESVLAEVREAREADHGGSEEPPEDAYTVVTSAESVFAPHVDELEARFVTGTEEDDAIPTEEIRSTALDMTPSPLTYYSMTLLSALVATAGLLLDAPAIVVGSMVIAPLIGSALTASVGTVLDERRMLWEGLKTQLLGLALAIAAATAFSLALRSAAFLPPALDVTTTRQIANRISPGLLSVVVGVCAGAAGAFGLATGVSVALVGVMVAAALVPAAAAVGIGIAWRVPSVALGAFLLLVLNALAIHLAAAAVLWHLGYRPDDATANRDGGLPWSRYASVAAVALVVLALFVAAGATVGTQIAFERQANVVAADVVDEERYEALELVSVTTEFGLPDALLASGDRAVTVVVSRPVDRRYPDLARTIADGIERETGNRVAVTVEFVDRQRVSAPARAVGSSRSR
ncbi:TIGR00341 family protein [Halobaculum marinum]|uniref:TIGR00341 family protein n=1 Tax=Halobaculum marinum TaxID=3031996 RepID=A0ABD5X077_9EURY|nr:TIGR00341 family protein [Halobaculum sp. DT55]